jgi:hypothetical protein
MSPVMEVVPLRLRFCCATSCVALIILGLQLLMGGRGLTVRGTEGTAELPRPAALSGELIDQEGELFFVHQEMDVGAFREKISYTAEFENRGRAPVRIVHVQPSCNCTATRLEKQALAPGEKGSVTMEVSPRPDLTGRRAYAIELDYEGTGRRRARFILYANYQPDVLVPPSLTVRCVTGEDATVTFGLTDFRERPLKITGLGASSVRLRARVVEQPARYLDGWRFVMEAVFSGSGLPPGEYDEVLTVHTSDPDRRTITIPVRVRRVARVRVAPPILFLRTGPGSRLEGKLFIDDSLGEPVEIQSINTSDERLRCEITASPHQSVVNVSCDRIHAPSEPMTIRLKTVRPIEEVIDIAVKVPSPSPPRSSP